MTDEIPKTFTERLQWAMRRAKVTNQSELARRVGVKPQSIQHLLDPKKNAQGSAFTSELARELNVSSLWLATGDGEPEVIHLSPAVMRELLAKLDAGDLLPDEGVMKRIYDSTAWGVAHDLSQARNTESLPRIKWEELMIADLRRPFELEVIDDALAPEIFRGCIALLDPDRPPEPAWPVLVRDRDGNHYLRDYEAGPAGRWSAVARARGYAPMDSESFGLTIVAAMDGYKRPPPTARPGTKP